ncbi:MAG: 2-amino-4-hydroxy-6-hydroxymethyldihydropteridine diphosphokinase [Actinobacteria bacterium]|uniref:2-amino-4-hydroxy-6-hydroxymethyldihydropteridine diphosphokinase n=1 Tax=freshwater metagenome TaxID=449393 RepID=A0A6J5YKB0_9ZZZZ|nr:2-amino-4-hydroxy-6-hydroxymethyldihydropteridine diphosphokinase [Actinomycetota bacterium]MTA78407.1 2-amino-4-hydroxy-6-hydroxymethyldihydropteridine diphosphokinase [Actinomycetota bacterium]
MTRAFLSLGSNMGDSLTLLRQAVASMDGVVAVSPLYRTDPVGGPEQDPFLNIVVELDTELAPHDLLGMCHRLESAADRVRVVRWGPRTLDVDIIWMDGVSMAEPDLEIPHPRMRARRFVMAPLADLAPDVAGPGWSDLVEGHVDLLGPLGPEQD